MGEGRGEGKESRTSCCPFFLYFYNTLGVITCIGNHGDRGEHGSEKQFKYVTTRHTVPQLDVSFPE